MVDIQVESRLDQLPPRQALPLRGPFTMSQPGSRFTTAEGTEPIVISSDEESDEGETSDSSGSVVQTVPVPRKPRPGNTTTVTIPSRIRTNSDRSPTLHFNSKRQKLERDPSLTDDGLRQTGLGYDAATQYGGMSLDLTEAHQEQGSSSNPLILSDEEVFFTKPPDGLTGSSNSFNNLTLSSTISQPIAPYFYDGRLRFNMYRGPGFEKFPVPLQSNEQHKFCHKWDAAHGVGIGQPPSYSESQNRLRSDDYQLADPAEDNENIENLPISPAEEECIQKIRDILPDIEQNFVTSIVRENYEIYRFGDEEIEILPDVNLITAEILEQGAYPKATPVIEVKKDLFEDETGKTIEWNKDHTTNRYYVVDSGKLLADYFGHVPTPFINKLMAEKLSLWDSFLHINTIETNYFWQADKPYRRLKYARKVFEDRYDGGFRSSSDMTYYARLVTELQAVKQHLAREKLKEALQQRLMDEEKDNLQKHRIEGALFECQCCFDEEVPLNKFVVCTDLMAHSFCYNCVRSLADSQVGLMKYEMLCMDGSGCKAALASDQIAKAIPLKTFDRLAFNQQQAEITAAKIEGLEQCPFCDFKAICDPIEINPIFSCQNPDCFKVTCRKCLQASHVPKTCEEVKRDHGLQARHKIEEARSEAMIRACPSCNAKIIKESGCNKMRCTCGTVICYVCKVDLSHDPKPYDHFTSKAGGCPLHDSHSVDRHAQDANEAEDKAIAEAKALDPTIEDSALRIETKQRNNKISDDNTTTQQGRQRGRSLWRPRRRRQEQRVVGVDPLPALPFAEPPAYNDPYGAPVGAIFGFYPPLQNQANPMYGFVNQEQVDAQERLNNMRLLATAGRIHNFRNDLAQRRQFQAQRSDQIEDRNEYAPQITFPPLPTLTPFPKRPAGFGFNVEASNTAGNAGQTDYQLLPLVPPVPGSQPSQTFRSLPTITQFHRQTTQTLPLLQRPPQLRPPYQNEIGQASYNNAPTFGNNFNVQPHQLAQYQTVPNQNQPAHNPWVQEIGSGNVTGRAGETDTAKDTGVPWYLLD